MKFKRTIGLALSISVLGLMGCSSEPATTETATPEAGEETAQATGLPDGFPEKTIEIIVPAAAGAELDLYARALVQGGDFGADVVVVNKPGASQTIGLTELVTRPSDGYSMAITSNQGVVIQPAYNDQLVYGEENFNYVFNVYDRLDYMLLARPDYEYQTMDEILTAMEGGEKFSIASPTTLSFDQLIFTYFFGNLGESKGVDYLSQVEHIASTSGTTGAQSDFLGGHVDLLSTNEGVGKTLIDEGLAIPLIIMSDDPSKLLPDVKTVAEAYDVVGCDQYYPDVYFAIKEDVPVEIAAYLNERLVEASKSEAYQEILKSMNNSLTTFPTMEEMAETMEKSNSVYEEHINKYFKQ